MAIVRFDCYEVDFAAGQLRKRGARIRLREQPWQVLAMLLEHPGEVVTRDDLQSRLWPHDVIVDFERNLNTAIARLREALGDSADRPRFIETLPPPRLSVHCSSGVLPRDASSRPRTRAPVRELQCRAFPGRLL
jgi:DNA-binding winged helix-turn-helix (wHTH) protein